MPEINETQFVANVKSWIDSICAEMVSADPDFPFLGAEVEVRGRGKLSRRDLILRPRRDPEGFALTGEVKLPDRPDGRSPYSEALVLDAHEKANSVGAEYFFTWNVNRFVLWQTFRPHATIFDRQLDFRDWANIASSDELSRPEIAESLKRRWEEFLLEYAAIYRGAKPFVKRSLDQWFIHLLESALDRPSVCAHAAIRNIYARENGFHKKLDEWMIRNLGATISAEDESDNLWRAARYSCYVLTNRIVFYDALRRKYPERLKPIAVPKNVKSRDLLRQRLAAAFEHAVAVTDDYETVFRGDEFGDGLPFLDDAAVDPWRELIEQVDAYDFTRLDYDIVGQIFDGLISPGERHRYGQHYTKSEIVDLINAFAIRRADANVLDPACGGGTFLIRAYARKKYLAHRDAAGQDHIDLLSRIYGVDLSAYAVHLSTISLATRDLIRASNYPRVACADFFDIAKGRKSFPAGISTQRDEVEHVPLPELDAVVGNPPYIRQEKLTADRKAKYRRLGEHAWHNLRLSGRSDVHVYFWPYAASFLKPDGHFCFLTSSSWLDVEYGFHLQRWLLENFAIVAVMESSVEPWFTDARVATTVTILRREKDIAKRLRNAVRFVQIRKPLGDILGRYQRLKGDFARLEASERVRDFIESVQAEVENDLWRVRVVRQKDLISALDLGGDEEGEEGPGETAHLDRGKDPASAHTGAKWGIHLRAPDIFFDLLDRHGDRFAPLGEIAEVKYGVKSGCDAFFYPRDVTDARLREMGPKRFKEVYGLTPSQTKRIRVCLAGDGSAHLIEAKYLEPLVHSVLDLKTGKIVPSELDQSILLVPEKRPELRKTHVLKYIEFGEANPLGTKGASPVPTKSTVACRASGERPWYDITNALRPFLCWPKAHQYKHIVARNADSLVCNCRLYGIDPRPGVDGDLLHRVLQSTVVALMKFLFGRFTGREGNLDTMVCDAKMMLVPDVRRIDRASADAILAAGKKLDALVSENLGEECRQPERRALDDAVLVGLGIKSAKRREDILVSLYRQMTRQIEEIRALEMIAQRNRLRAARKGRATPQSLGAEIWDALLAENEESLHPFPGGFLPGLDSTRADVLQVPEGRSRMFEMFGSFAVEIGEATFEVGAKERALLLIAIAGEDYEGPVALPQSPKTCKAILDNWSSYKSELTGRFERLAEERTADPSIHERVVSDLWRRFRRWSGGRS